MKILYVSTNYEHANDSELNLIHGLMEVAEISFFGPGFSTTDELEDGLEKFWVKKNYDALILNFALATSQMAYLNLRFEYKQHRYVMSDYSIYECIRYADRIIEAAKKIEKPKLVHYHFDTANMADFVEKCLQDLLDSGFYLWSVGEEAVPEIVENENTKKIQWGNQYLKFCRRNADKIVSMLAHVATYREFFGKPLAKRKYDITVPGNLDSKFYPDREKIVSKLKETNYKIYDDYDNRELAYRSDDRRITNTMYTRDEDKALDLQLEYPCFYMNTAVKREAIASWREKYNVGLRVSKMGYADGGWALQIVRKYIEIPVRGTLLLCQDIPPLECFGFKAWKNMVPVTSDSVIEVCNYLYQNPDKMQDIATSGRRMVLEKHSPITYAKHIIDAIKVISTGRFRGSYWYDGEFYIN